jgi:hypothetical protein
MNRANNALHVRPESSDVAMNEPVSCDLIITFGSRIMLCHLGVEYRYRKRCQALGRGWSIFRACAHALSLTGYSVTITNRAVTFPAVLKDPPTPVP